jgi:tRNA-specific 2-thiouridylase
MSGGVDSSVAAALLLEQGHEVTGVTMRLWGGESDAGCCSVADVDDARRVAQQLGIDHLVFNFSEAFEERVVSTYVEAHRRGLTPNPCIECNRHLKFDRLLSRAAALGFDLVATGHHARVRTLPDGRRRICRGVDGAKDQSYVLYMLRQRQLQHLVLPVGALTKAEVRAEAARLGLRTAGKPDSQDVCFITATGGREAFLGERIPLRPGRVVDRTGREVGRVEHVELVTVGQRKGLGVAGGGVPRYALSVDVPGATVTVGERHELAVTELDVRDVVWSDLPVEGELLVQCSAHGTPRRATITLVDPGAAGPGSVRVRWVAPSRRVAPGQSVVFYDGDDVVGGGVAT